MRSNSRGEGLEPEPKEVKPWRSEARCDGEVSTVSVVQEVLREVRDSQVSVVQKVLREVRLLMHGRGYPQHQ